MTNLSGGAVDLSKLHRHKYVTYVICPLSQDSVNGIKKAREDAKVALAEGREVEDFKFEAGEPIGMRGPCCIKCNLFWEQAIDVPCPVSDEEFEQGVGTPGRVGESWFQEGLRTDEE